MRNYEKIYKKGNLNGEKFMHFSKWIVKNYVGEYPDNPLSALDRANIAEVMAMDLATGSQLTKNKYIMTGVVIGGSLVASVVLINKLRKR
ncbi:MAG: hypothetical protein RBT15_04790 [Gudongella sp.]|jgi:hypothetical protein|nr:hypothetical protein [Gudongella sp.]